eukprot:953608-Amphidinium_carterae.1
MASSPLTALAAQWDPAPGVLPCTSSTTTKLVEGVPHALAKRACCTSLLGTESMYASGGGSAKVGTRRRSWDIATERSSPSPGSSDHCTSFPSLYRPQAPPNFKNVSKTSPKKDSQRSRGGTSPFKALFDFGGHFSIETP